MRRDKDLTGLPPNPRAKKKDQEMSSQGVVRAGLERQHLEVRLGAREL